MKICGQGPLPVPSEVIPFQRYDEKGKLNLLCIKLTAVDSYDEFEAICPEPKPLIKEYPDGRQEPYLEDPNFKEAFMEHHKLKHTWAFMQAFRDNPGMQWEDVDPTNPKTWHLCEKELRAWFLPAEMIQLANKWAELSGISTDRITKLRDGFLSGQLQVVQFQPHFQTVAQVSTPSSEPAKEPESASPVVLLPGTNAQ